MRFVDAEALAVGFLKPVVFPTKVGTLVPNPRPTAFVRAYRSGGGATNRVLETANITVEGQAPTTTEAFELTAKCREAFFNLYTRMPLVRGVDEAGGLYFAPDPTTNIPRYRFTMALRLRAAR